MAGQYGYVMLGRHLVIFLFDTKIFLSANALEMLAWLGPSPASLRYVMYFRFCGPVGLHTAGEIWYLRLHCFVCVFTKFQFSKSCGHPERSVVDDLWASPARVKVGWMKGREKLSYLRKGDGVHDWKFWVENISFGNPANGGILV